MEPKEDPLLRDTLFTEGDKKLLQFTCGGLIAVDFLFIQGYLSLTQLDSFEKTAMNCFAAAIPFLVVYAIGANLLDAECKSLWIKLGVAFLASFAIMINLYGIYNSFMHFSTEIGEIFFSSSIFALLLLSKVFVLPLTKRTTTRTKTNRATLTGNRLD